ncbi:hypothetical protein ACTFIT_011032 [Dictyostelium discoideum]
MDKKKEAHQKPEDIPEEFVYDENDLKKNSITKFNEKKNSKSSEVNNIESLLNEKRETKKLIQQLQQSKQKINQQKQKQQKSYKNLAIEGNVFINGYATNHGHKEDNIL